MKTKILVNPLFGLTDKEFVGLNRAYLEQQEKTLTFTEGDIRIRLPEDESFFKKFWYLVKIERPGSRQLFWEEKNILIEALLETYMIIRADMNAILGLSRSKFWHRMSIPYDYRLVISDRYDEFRIMKLENGKPTTTNDQPKGLDLPH